MMLSVMMPRGVFGTRSHQDSRLRRVARRRATIALRPVGEGLEGRSLMANLGLDPTFGFGGVANSPVPASTSNTFTYQSITGLALQADGKILGVGTRNANVVSPSSVANSVVVERFNPDGTLDASYGTNGVFVVPRVTIGADTLDMTEKAAVLQSDGKLVILAQATGTVGGSSVSDFEVVRILPNGALDTSFGVGGYQSINFSATATPDNTASPTSIAIGPNGQIVVAGSFTNPATSNQDFAVAQLTSGGALDTSFGVGGKQTVAFDLGGDKDDLAYGVAVQADGKVVLVGSADVGVVTIGGSDRQNSDIAVARLTPQGALDATFGAGGKVTVAYDLGDDRADVGSSVLLVGDQIVIGGSSSVSASPSPFSTTIQTATLTRLSSAGSVLSKFTLSLSQQGVSFSTAGRTLTALADGSILLGGTANSFAGSSYGQFFTDFNADGSVKTTYGTDGTSLISGNPVIGNVAVQPDGKLVYADSFSVTRTTGPAPAVVAARLVMPNAKPNARSNLAFVAFNTVLNATLAGNKKSYLFRIGRGRAFNPRSVVYNAETRTVTFRLPQSVNRRAKLVLVIAPLGIAGADSQFLNGGQPTTIPIAIG